jgi:S1-C subfamily serine protease
MKIRARLGKFFKNCIAKYQDSSEYDTPELTIASSKSLRLSDDEIASGNRMNFTVTPAHGGMVLTFRKYDDRKDQNHYVNYIISDNQDVAEEVGRIIAMEMMKL